MWVFEYLVQRSRVSFCRLQRLCPGGVCADVRATVVANRDLYRRVCVSSTVHYATLSRHEIQQKC